MKSARFFFQEGEKPCVISPVTCSGQRGSMQSSALHYCFDALLVVRLAEVLGHFWVVIASP